MEPYKVLITGEAEKDLKQIRNYIHFDLQNPVSVSALISKLKDSILSLEDLPYRHGLVKDSGLAVISIRKIRVENYLVFYQVDEHYKSVYIVRVLSARRDWENLV
ncbi:MAG: type II toxin-antitoxin system RelE/ParE family toxin [Anaerolineaceae bacterium]|nr:type II toxin-antitoxin system RelE/ParE family toxin [Anaerolineaceae bacterium]